MKISDIVNTIAEKTPSQIPSVMAFEKMERDIELAGRMNGKYFNIESYSTTLLNDLYSDLKSSAYDICNLMRLTGWMGDADIDDTFFERCEKRLPATVSDKEFDDMVLTAIRLEKKMQDN